MPLDAYALGWATTGAPADLGARLALAEKDKRHDAGPAALFMLGSLDGAWAVYFRRRLTLHADTEAAVLAAWLAYVATMDTTRVRAALDRDRKSVV